MKNGETALIPSNTALKKDHHPSGKFKIGGIV
jgi:hypothetical protein